MMALGKAKQRLTVLLHHATRLPAAPPSALQPWFACWPLTAGILMLWGEMDNVLWPAQQGTWRLLSR